MAAALQQQADPRAVLGPDPEESVDALLRDLGTVRRAGYAFDDEMVTPGIACLAAPVFSHEGLPIAAIGVTYVAAQRSRADVELAIALVREVTGRLSTNLGHVAPADTTRVLAG
jgi:IclR family acetate operon transcriptional repressor